MYRILVHAPRAITTTPQNNIIRIYKYIAIFILKSKKKSSFAPYLKRTHTYSLINCIHPLQSIYISSICFVLFSFFWFSVFDFLLILSTNPNCHCPKFTHSFNHSHIQQQQQKIDIQIFIHWFPFFVFWTIFFFWKIKNKIQKKNNTQRKYILIKLLN